MNHNTIPWIAVGFDENVPVVMSSILSIPFMIYDFHDIHLLFNRVGVTMVISRREILGVILPSCVHWAMITYHKTAQNQI